MNGRKPVSVSRPMARAEGLLIEQIGEETVAYDLKSKEAHCLRPLAAVVFAHADGRNTLGDLAELATYRLGTSVSEAEIKDAVAQLEQRGLLDVPLVVRDGLSRREAVQRFATVAGVAAATPLIATVVAPTAAMAATNIPTGQCCGSTTTKCTGLNSSCASNHCCQNISSKDCNQCKCVGDKNDCTTTQCSNPAGNCPPITVIINGVPTILNPCAQTSSGKCCYPDANNNCCTVFTSGNTLVSC
jgi:hypothetical protein